MKNINNTCKKCQTQAKIIKTLRAHGKEYREKLQAQKIEADHFYAQFQQLKSVIFSLKENILTILNYED